MNYNFGGGLIVKVEQQAIVFFVITERLTRLRVDLVVMYIVVRTSVKVDASVAALRK